LRNICKIKVHCYIVLPVHIACTKFRWNLTFTTLVTRWRTLETLNRVFSISQNGTYLVTPLNASSHRTVTNVSWTKYRWMATLPWKYRSNSKSTILMLRLEVVLHFHLCNVQCVPKSDTLLLSEFSTLVRCIIIFAIFVYLHIIFIKCLWYQSQVSSVQMDSPAGWCTTTHCEKHY